jgi:molecular chaperone DnaK (HSP70)
VTDRIYGIDLGTTYSCIACVDEYGKPVVFRNQEGASTTPSVVRFEGDRRIVGTEARNVSELYPDAVVSMVKREMGTLWRKLYEGVAYSPEEISSYILRKLVADVAAATRETVKDVVITVPAWFGIAERRATELAGELAGLTVRAILNEPTAAAFAYGMSQESDQRVLVYDLGGGTFDITLIDIIGGTIDVVATGGNHLLGGRDWDSDIVTYLAAEWQASTGSCLDPVDSLESRNRLYRDAESMKRSLSVKDRVEIAVSHAGQVVRVPFTREKLEELTQARLEETIAHTRQTLQEAHTVLESRGRPVSPLFHKLLLVGGSTKMPQVARRLRQELHAEPQSFDPDEAVAKGAALYGQKLRIGAEVTKLLAARGFRGDAQVPKAVEQQVLEQAADVFGLPGPAVATLVRRATRIVASRSYGVVVMMGQTRELKVYNLIQKNDRLPVKVSHRFGTHEANQAAAVIQVMENVEVSRMAAIEDSREIGRAELALPPGLPASAPIEITCMVSAEGFLQVMGFDPQARRSIEVELRLDGVLLPTQTEEISARSRQLVVC